MIYFLEDDDSIRELVIYTLRNTGMEAMGFSRPSAFWEAMQQEELPALVLLDIMLPEEDGVSVLKKLRANRATKTLPVIMLTAKGTEYDQVMGLDYGADDYIPKPFGMMALIARIKAVLRRSAPSEEEQEYVLGDLYVNPTRHIVRVGKEPVSLTLKEFELLCLLLEHQGVVFTRDRLLNHIWGYAFDGESRAWHRIPCRRWGIVKKRIFCSMVALVGSAMALCFIFITGLLYEHYSNLQTEQLKETASYIEQGYEAAGQSYLETLQTGTNRVTLIAKDGTVLYDSQEQDVSQMGNHADREEVQQAEQDGVGFSRRFSSTMSKETVYYAIRLSDQSVLRVSVEYRSLFAMMGVLLMQALFILLVMLILALLVSYQLTKKIVKPINTLDLEHPEQVSTYEELDPLLCH